MAALSRRRLLALPAALAAAAASAQQRGRADLLARLETPQGPLRVVIDSDAYNEVDDQFAVAYALRSPERITVEALYAAPFVNTRAETPKIGMERSYDELLRLLELLAVDAPEGFVQRGSERYLRSAEDRLESPAALDLIRRAMHPRDEPLWVIGLGCPSNIAAAMILEPRIVERIIVLWIGGQIRTSDSAADFNIRQDYFASSALYDSGVALVNIPGFLVAEQLRTTVWELEHFLKGRSKIGDYLYRIVERYYRERRRHDAQPWSKVIWDIATIGFLVNPEWVPTRIEASPVLQPDMTWRLDPGRHPVRVATRVERDEIYDDLFRKLSR